MSSSQSSRMLALGAMGAEFGTLVLISLYLGVQADQRWGMEPLFTLVGLLTGLAAAVLRMMHYLRWLSSRSERADDD